MTFGINFVTIYLWSIFAFLYQSISSKRLSEYLSRSKCRNVVVPPIRTLVNVSFLKTFDGISVALMYPSLPRLSPPIHEMLFSRSVNPMYEPIAAQAMQIVSQYGSYEILETKLQAAVEERAKIVFARYGAMTLLENRATLSAQVQEEVKELEELFPVNFTQVVVKDIDFSDAFEQAVEAKMQAEQNALRAENEKQEAITRAEQEREVARVEAEAAVLAAEGEARALEITREALENMPDTWIAQQYLEKWDGKLPQFITGDGSGLMLTPNLEQ